jgi:outer membrane lipoprotein-sorting protein
MILNLTAVLSIGQSASPDITDYTQRNLKDATFVARKVRAVQTELKKINDDFGAIYRFDRITFFYREPLMLRVEAQVEETSAVYIIDGPIQMFRVPRLRLNQRMNLKDAPGRRQTPLDFGVLTSGMFKDLFQARFVRMDRATNDAVFDLTYRSSDDTSRHRVWVDTEKGITTKREWYNQPGRQIATFTYEKPEKQNGCWIATEVTVRNVDNKVAGILRYEKFRVNTGLKDALFELK